MDERTQTTDTLDNSNSSDIDNPIDSKPSEVQDEKQDTPLDYIILGFTIICGITAYVSLRLNIESSLFFWSATIVFVSVFIIKPLKSFVERSRDEAGLLLGRRLLLGLKVACAFLGIIGLYGVVYVPYYKFESYYWLFTIAILVLIFAIYENTFEKMV